MSRVSQSITDSIEPTGKSMLDPNRSFCNLYYKKFAGLMLLLLTAAFVGNTAIAETGADPENCLSCHDRPWLAVMDDSTGVRDFHIDPYKYASSVHGRLDCRQCHQDIEQVPHNLPVKRVDCSTSCHIVDPYTGKVFSHKKIQKELETSVHSFNPASEFNEKKPACRDCHTNSLFREQISAELENAQGKCRSCHEDFKELDRSLKHLTLHLSQDEMWSNQKSFNSCIRCHTDQELVSDSLQIKLKEDVVVSFLETFHGRGFSFGDERSPVCADCHGYHGVYAQVDERSMIHDNNLQQTCGTTGCHDDATFSFATAGSMHNFYDGFEANLLFIIKNVYIFLILMTVGTMVLHNSMDLKAYLRNRKKHPEPENKKRRRFTRLTKRDRVSHFIMFVSFGLLAITGALLWLPPENFGSLPEYELFMPIRAWSHRIAAVLITMASLYHILYATMAKRGRKLLWAIFPKFEDLKLIGQNISFMLGKREHPPKFGYFNYMEKIEYWAYAWGSIVMTVTGIILWFETLGSKYIVDVARLVHSLEAILAVISIVIWHFWNVHWKPGRWPMSETWIDGTIDEEALAEEHSAVLEEFDNNPPEGELTRRSLVIQGIEVEVARERRTNRPDSIIRAVGWIFVLIAVIAGIIMSYSFVQYLRPALDPADANSSMTVSISDLEVSGDPGHALYVAHEDIDWQHGHFHAAMPVVVEDKESRKSECLMCHEILPHKKNLQLRADLNLHSRFMTCEVCHSSEMVRNSSKLIWADLRIDTSGEPKMPFGLHVDGPNNGENNFSSQLAFKKNNKLLFEDQTSPRSIDFLGKIDNLNDSQMEKETEKFHDRIVVLKEMNPACDECHNDNSWIDFEKLGFDEDRTRQLKSSTETARVTKYDTFILPPQY
jgi:cytochrome b subunit of formate dehydrogenase